MYRALSLLSGHIDDIQAGVYACSARFMERRDRVIYYDCTNYYFEIEDNDRDTVDIETGELVAGLRKRGKSKENRPSPIVQSRWPSWSSRATSRSRPRSSRSRMC